MYRLFFNSGFNKYKSEKYGLHLFQAYFDHLKWNMVQLIVLRMQLKSKQSPNMCNFISI